MSHCRNIESLSKSLANPEDAKCIAGCRCAFLALCCWTWALADGQALSDAAVVLEHPKVMRNLLYLGVCTTAGGWYLQTIIQGRVKAQEFALILSGEPIFATLVAVFVLDSRVTGHDVVGGVLVVVACLSNEVSFSWLGSAGGGPAKPKVVDV